MSLALLTDRRHVLQLPVFCVIFCLLSFPAALSLAQDTDVFDPIAVGSQLDEVSEQLGAEDVATEFLTEARAAVVLLDAAAASCRQQSTEERQRLEARYEPLADIDDDVAPAVFDQRVEIRRLLDEAIDRQTRCSGVKDYTEALLARITETQNQLSQQYLSNRSKSVIVLLREMPARLTAWPGQIRSSVDLDLVEGVTPASLLWVLVTAGLIGAGFGVWIRHRFSRWYAAAGGDDMPALMKYLVPKPLAEYAPLLLFGFALASVLFLAIRNDPQELALVRIALGFLLFGIGCVVIDWVTGPLSPSARVKGLIPDHVQPLRLRLRFFMLTLVASFVFLG